jgi:hypothetical protein
VLVGYWGRGGDVLDCLLADHECSTAVATWTLNVISSAAFIAALIAGIYAKRAYGLETKLSLGQGPCDVRDHEKPRAIRYVERPDVISDYTNSPQSDFTKVDYDFLNLGRSPLEDVQVALQLYWLDDWYVRVRSGRDSPATINTIDIGPIPTDCSAHVSIWFLKTLISQSKIPFIGWDPNASNRGALLEFTPYQYVLVYQSQDKTTGDVMYYLRRSATKDQLRTFAEKLPSIIS